MPLVTIENNENSEKSEEILVSSTLPLLFALEERGIKLPSGCLSGTCGVCKVHVTSGGENLTPLGAVEEETLNYTEQNDGQTRLSCKARALGDLRIHL